MSLSAGVATISVDVSTSMVAVVALVTVLVIGLATLARPSPATVAWGIAFGLGMLGTFMWVAAQQMDAPALRASASGVMVGFEALVWLGLRLHLGRRPVWWPAVAFVVLAPVILATTALTPAFQATFRIVFLIAGVFAALTAYELFRRPSLRRDIALPLALGSCAFVIVAIVGGISALVDTGMSAAVQMGVLREVNGVGTLLTSICAAFTIVLLVRADGLGDRGSDDAAARARRRLGKAARQHEPDWSVLDVRLDDPADLREASTSAGFALLVDRFHDDIVESLPASADAERVSDDRSIILIHGSEQAVRSHIRAMLQRISEIEDGGPMPGMRLSASVGWATAGAAGYDYDALVVSASDAAVRAREEGGDRWVTA